MPANVGGLSAFVVAVALWVLLLTLPERSSARTTNVYAVAGISVPAGGV